MNYTEILLKKASVRLKGIDGRIITGFSGGADSTALLSVLLETFGSERITAVHINHMLRGKEADADERFCREFCAERGVDFVCEKIDVRSICGESAVEETARNCRYEAFSEIASEKNAEYIALAHTASDNLETVLFNLCRGSGLSGMRGIPFSRPCGSSMIIRPLIDCTRDEIIGYDGENGLSFVTDKTNYDTHYTRNFIRAEIVPKLKEIFPAAEKAVGNMSDTVALDYDFLRSLAIEFIKENTAEGKIPAAKLAALHPALMRRVVSEMYGDTLDSVQIRRICDMINRGEDDRTAVSGKLFAVVVNGGFGFEEFKEREHRPEFKIKINRGKNRSELGFCFCENGFNAPEGYILIGEAEIPETLFPGLYARSRVASDKYVFWKMTRIIKKMIVDFPENAKRIRPVLCAGDEVIWYPGFPAAEFKNSDKKIKIKYYEKMTEVNEYV